MGRAKCEPALDEPLSNKNRDMLPSLWARGNQQKAWSRQNWSKPGFSALVFMVFIIHQIRDEY